MPDILEDEFKKTLSNIKDFTIKSNNENTSVSEIEKYLIEVEDKNSSQENIQYEDDKEIGNDSLKLVHQHSKLSLRCDIKNNATDNQLDSGIGTDDSLPHFPHNVEEYQLQLAKANGLSKCLKYFIKLLFWPF